MAKNIFRREKRLDELPGSAVKDQYDSKINKFLHHVDEPGLGWLQSHGLAERPNIDLLNNLFSWGDRVWNERKHLQAQLSRAQEKIKSLETELLDTKRRFSLVQDENEHIKERHRGEVNHIKEQHQGEVESLYAKHSTVVEREKDVHGREVKKLVGQLLVNQDDNMGWTDDKLKLKFQQLQTSISSLVSPRTKDFRLPPGAQLGADLDPTGFLVRTTKSKVHFLLQSTIWAILYEQFFSTPFGFGVLGCGSSRKTLLDIYIAWVKLLGKAAYDGDGLSDTFRDSKFINNWRSAMFQCIQESLTETSRQPNAFDAPIVSMMKDNVNQTASRIKYILFEVSKLSGSSHSTELEGKVQQITDQAQGMALQFGVHHARMQLFMPKRGDEVRIGSEVHDCEDGDCDRGARHLVDIVTLPGLQKLGDGLSDMELKRTLVPCEIYPNQA